MATPAVFSIKSNGTGGIINNLKLVLNVDGQSNPIVSVMDIDNLENSVIQLALSNMEIARVSNTTGNNQENNSITMEIRDNVDITTYSYDGVSNTNIEGVVKEGQSGTLINCENINIIGHVDGLSTIGNGDF